MSKQYSPAEFEEKWYSFWEENDFFKARADSQKPAYCIPIPPPNVTGVLHMGHALVDTLQDVLVRYKRMAGFEALWVPGTDHAGIATQTVVERDQMAKTGKRRSDFEREEFLSLVWEWKEKSQGHILNQLRRLGCSCDWDRLAFTMDETRSHAVKALFKKMFDEGLIYRGDYLVNWDPITQTALADDEVEYEERETRLCLLRYPIDGNDGFIEVATTRAETMLGDTAVAVNPKDERYKALVGKMVRLPITGRLVPIIVDGYVDPEFGSGAVKITPAHDPNDYEIGLRHDLPMINLMTPDGKMNENTGEFEGLTMEEGRLAVIEKLKTLGAVVKVEPYNHRVGVSYRSKAVIEPYLSKQWFVKMSDFKKPLIDAVKTGSVKIIPKDWESTYFHWIDNLRDWCISRQLWWGHRIPIWYRDGEMVCYAGEGLPPEVEKDPKGWEQDPDVLDTWFSSALWPMSIHSWPEKTADFEKFYPASVLVTGHDILFFWVARMILMGQYCTGKAPFPETFIHGLIYGKSYWRYGQDGNIAFVTGKERLDYDLGKTPPPEVHSKWEKMSKSKGNVIDPIEIIDTYGTDAMRMALTSVTTHARQIDLDRRRFEEQKNFINKIWNGARFVLMNLEDLSKEDLAKGINSAHLKLEDKWILSRLNSAIKEMHTHLEIYAFDKTAHLAYTFFWDVFCAYYLELVKPTLFGKAGSDDDRLVKKQILFTVLTETICLFHPFIPFITEELFTQLKERFETNSAGSDPYITKALQALASPACIVAPYPEVINRADINPEIEADFAFMEKVVRAVRNIRAEMQLPPSVETDCYITGEGKELDLVKRNRGILEALVRLGTLSLDMPPPSEGFSASSTIHSLTLTIPLPEEMRTKEKLRLEKLQAKLIQKEQAARGKLANKEFVEGAPEHVVKKFEQSLSEMEKELVEISKKLNSL